MTKCNECGEYASHFIINKDGKKELRYSFCCKHYLEFIEEEGNEFIHRKCLICGKKLKIKLYKDGHYKGGEYFGKIKPVLKFAKKPYRYTRIAGHKFGIVRVLKYGKEYEYWECNKCYNEPGRK